MKIPSGKKCDIATLTEIYGDKDVAMSILSSAQANKTVSRIEDGTLNLPELHDAFEYHNRKMWTDKGIDQQTQDVFVNNPRLHGMFSAFEKRLSAIELVRKN